MTVIDQVALAASLILPLWNLPLIIRIYQRKSSKDISLYWALGVWVCLVLMFPSAVKSQDVVWRVFNVVNFFFFTLVMGFVVAFRKGPSGKD